MRFEMFRATKKLERELGFDMLLEPTCEIDVGTREFSCDLLQFTRGDKRE